MSNVICASPLRGRALVLAHRAARFLDYLARVSPPSGFDRMAHETQCHRARIDQATLRSSRLTDAARDGRRVFVGTRNASLFLFVPRLRRGPNAELGRREMMAVQIGGAVYELEGVLFRRMPSCSVRKAGGRQITQAEIDALSDDDRMRLLGLIQCHIEAVALLAGERAL